MKIGGSQSSGRAFTLYTGLAAMEVVAVNPTITQLREITGNEKMPEVLANYEKRELFGELVRPVTFWLRNIENNIFVPVTINVSNKEKKASEAGNFQFINALGQTSWGKSADAIASNPKMKWYSTEGIRPVYFGEENLYPFMQRLIRYNSSTEGANWLADMNNYGITVEKLYAADYDGIREFVNYAQENSNRIGVVLEVRETEKEGNIKNYQQVIPRENAFFATGVDGAITGNSKISLATASADRLLSKNFYTVEFMEFTKDKCFNYSGPTEAPAEVLQAAGSALGEVKDDLPF